MLLLEVQRPELEALIRQRMQSGAFSDVDELLALAMGALATLPRASLEAMGATNLVQLFEPLRGLLTDEEIERLFSRDPSGSRPIDLS